MCCVQVRHASVSSSVKQSCFTEHQSVITTADDDDDDDDYIMVDKHVVSSPVSEADKNVDKLLKFVADNDIEMVGTHPAACLSVYV